MYQNEWKVLSTSKLQIKCYDTHINSISPILYCVTMTMNGENAVQIISVCFHLFLMVDGLNLSMILARNGKLTSVGSIAYTKQWDGTLIHYIYIYITKHLTKNQLYWTIQQFQWELRRDREI